MIESTKQASEVIWLKPKEVDWSLADLVGGSCVKTKVIDTTEAIVRYLVETAITGDHLLVMSNGSFEGIHGRIINGLKEKFKIREMA